MGSYSSPRRKNMQKQISFEVMSNVLRRELVSPNNPNLPLNKFIGNEEAIRRLSRAAFSAFGKDNHKCSDYSFALYGPPSTGKTYLAKLFAETVDLPFVVIEPQMAKTTHDIFTEINSVLSSYEGRGVKKGELSLYDYGDKNLFVLPLLYLLTRFTT